MLSLIFYPLSWVFAFNIMVFILWLFYLLSWVWHFMSGFPFIFYLSCFIFDFESCISCQYFQLLTLSSSIFHVLFDLEFCLSCQYFKLLTLSSSIFHVLFDLEFFISCQYFKLLTLSSSIFHVLFDLEFCISCQYFQLLTLLSSTQVGNIGEEKAQARFAKIFIRFSI